MNSREKLAARLAARKVEMKPADTVPFERPEGEDRVSKPVPVHKPVFYLQLVDANTRQALADFPGGGVFEREIVSDIVRRISDKLPALLATIKGRKIGFWRTQKQTEKEITAVIETLAPKLVEDAINEALYDLKAETLRLV